MSQRVFTFLRAAARRRFLVLLLLPAVAAPLHAHGTGLLANGPAWWLGGVRSAGSVAAVALAALLYAIGSFRGPRRASASRLYWAGWSMLAIALISPVHPLGEVLFSAHMAQHELLMIAAAPLLVLARPGPTCLRALPRNWRRGLAPPLCAIRPAMGWLLRPLPAGLIHAVALWTWHVPFLFEAALASPLAHAAQHACFLFSALLFWQSVFYPTRTARCGRGAGLVSLFATALHTTVLGALLTCAGHPWYPHYAATTEAWGYSPLEDQQIGGLIMWVPAGLVYLAAALALFSHWLRDSSVPAVAQPALPS